MGNEQLTPAEFASLRLPDADANALVGEAGREYSIRDLHFAVGELFALSFAKLTGGESTVGVADMNQSSFGEYRLKARDAAVYRSRTIQPGGSVFLELPATVCGLVLEAMLHGSDERPAAARFAATEIENRLLQKAVAAFFDAFQEIWRSVVDFELGEVKAANELGELKCFRAEQSVTLLTYRLVSSDNSRGDFKLGLPGDWPLPLIEAALAARRERERRNAENENEKSTQSEIIVRLAETQLGSEELSKLAVGDIIPTDKFVGEPLEVLIDGELAFRANLEKVGDNKAVKLVERIEAAAANVASDKDKSDSDATASASPKSAADARSNP